jgi:hypothetical protein
MAIYLDNCSFNRPHDDQKQERVRVEAEAVESILLAIAERRLQIVWSDILEVENDENPFEERRTAIQQWRFAAVTHVHDSEGVRSSARDLSIWL